MKATVLFGTISLVALATTCAAQISEAQTCAKPIRIVVPYPPGAPDDVIGRLLAAKLSEVGERYYVENIPGAAGAIGASAVAKAPSDGCTLLIVNQNFVIQPAVNSKTSYSLSGFSAVSQLATAPEAISVNPSVPASSMKELVALLKRHPGEYSYASPGYGSSPHLAAERLFKVTLGLDVLHVPFQGGPPAVNAAIGGHIQIVPLTLPLVAPFVKDGKLRMLAVASQKRVAAFLDVPTLAEAGYPDLEIGYWNGIVMPVGAPASMIDALNDRIRKAIASPEVAERLREIDFTPTVTSPAAFAAHLQSEAKRWDAIARQSSVRIE
jgi:tripartite-type tricarboxylate transporter receptor subunit TctC